MYFDSVQAAMTMDGHGVYVWMAYLVAIAVIAIVLVAPTLRSKRILKQLAGEHRREQHASGTSAEKRQ